MTDSELWEAIRSDIRGLKGSVEILVNKQFLQDTRIQRIESGEVRKKEAADVQSAKMDQLLEQMQATREAQIAAQSAREAQTGLMKAAVVFIPLLLTGAMWLIQHGGK